MAREDRPQRIERMLEEMRWRGYVRDWRVEQRLDSRQWFITVRYDNNRYQKWAVDADRVGTPQYYDYICEKIERDLIKEIAEQKRSVYYYSPDDYAYTIGGGGGEAVASATGGPGYKVGYPYDESVEAIRKIASAPEEPQPSKNPPLSPSNAYRFEYLEFMEVKKS